MRARGAAILLSRARAQEGAEQIGIGRNHALSAGEKRPSAAAAAVALAHTGATENFGTGRNSERAIGGRRKSKRGGGVGQRKDGGG